MNISVQLHSNIMQETAFTNIPYIKCPFIVLKITKIDLIEQTMNKIQVVLHNYTYCRRERRTKTMPPLGGDIKNPSISIHTCMYMYIKHHKQTANKHE